MQTHGYVGAEWPTIDSFFGSHRFLSNFYPTDVEMDGVVYPSLEHAYQASKSDDAAIRHKVLQQPTPGSAKKLGATLNPSDQWKLGRIALMSHLIRQKFARPFLNYLLMETGSATLIEGNGWDDTFWGMSYGEGTNHLGNLLMQRRDELLQAPPKVLRIEGDMPVGHDAWEFVDWATTRFRSVLFDGGAGGNAHPSVHASKIEAEGVMAVRRALERYLANLPSPK